MQRRGFLLGLSGLLALPAIARAGVLMPISSRHLIEIKALSPIKRVDYNLVQTRNLSGGVSKCMGMVVTHLDGSIMVYTDDADMKKVTAQIARQQAHVLGPYAGYFDHERVDRLINSFF